MKMTLGKDTYFYTVRLLARVACDMHGVIPY